MRDCLMRRAKRKMKVCSDMCAMKFVLRLEWKWFISGDGYARLIDTALMFSASASVPAEKNCAAAFSEIQEEPPYYIGARKWAMSYTLSPWEALERGIRQRAHTLRFLFICTLSPVLFTLSPLILSRLGKRARLYWRSTNAAYCFKCSSLNRLEWFICVSIRPGQDEKLIFLYVAA